MLILNHDAFDEQGLKKAGYTSDPRKDESLSGYQVYDLPITSLTVAAVESSWLSRKQASLSKNMFTLGIIAWMYDRSIEDIIERVDRLFAKKKPELAEANKLALQAGYNYADTVEVFTARFQRKQSRAAARELPAYQWQRSVGPGLPRGVGDVRPLIVLCFLPDYARQRHPARVVQIAPLRRKKPSRRKTKLPLSAWLSAPPTAGPWA